MDKKISIIIPTWNREKEIQKAIKSVQNQTVQDFEILVCDDGSTDNTEKIVFEMIKADSRIKWVPGEHSGRPAVPRNNGIKNAQGEWLAFLDSDDEWLPDKLETQLTSLSKTKLKASSSNAYNFKPTTNEKKIFSNFDKKIIIFTELVKSNFVITSSAIIHNSLISKISFFPTGVNQKGIEDYSFWLRVATQTDFDYVDTPLLVYTDDATNSIRGKSENNGLIQKKIIFSNFISWGIKNKINFKFLFPILNKYIKNYLKLLLKK